jgi:hypothetical protein
MAEEDKAKAEEKSQKAELLEEKLKNANMEKEELEEVQLPKKFQASASSLQTGPSKDSPRRSVVFDVGPEEGMQEQVKVILVPS